MEIIRSKRKCFKDQWEQAISMYERGKYLLKETPTGNLYLSKKVTIKILGWEFPWRKDIAVIDCRERQVVLKHVDSFREVGDLIAEFQRMSNMKMKFDIDVLPFTHFGVGLGSQKED